MNLSEKLKRNNLETEKPRKVLESEAVEKSNHEDVSSPKERLKAKLLEMRRRYEKKRPKNNQEKIVLEQAIVKGVINGIVRDYMGKFERMKKAKILKRLGEELSTKNNPPKNIDELIERENADLETFMKEEWGDQHINNLEKNGEESSIIDGEPALDFFIEVPLFGGEGVGFRVEGESVKDLTHLPQLLKERLSAMTSGNPFNALMTLMMSLDFYGMSEIFDEEENRRMIDNKSF